MLLFCYNDILFLLIRLAKYGLILCCHTQRDVQWIKDLKRESLPPLAAQSSSAMAPMQPEMSDYVLLEPAPQEDARPCNESHNMDKNTAGATCEQPRPDIQMTRLQILVCFMSSCERVGV